MLQLHVTVFSVKGNDYRIYFRYMSEDEAINLSKNAELTEKEDHCKT